MNLSSCTFLAATALLVAEALHLETPLSEDARADGVRPKRKLSHTKVDMLPELSTYKTKFSTLVPSTDIVPVMPEVKLVMGIFTTSQELHYRDIVRTTWMKQRGVCKAPEGPQENCSVYAVFVQGHNRSVADSSGFQQGDNESDMVFLPTAENMDEGKTLSYFGFALETYPWATHYGKMDMDVLPRWGPIVEGFKHIPAGCEAYLGKPWNCQKLFFCPTFICGPPPASGLLRERGSLDPCWTYMQGGLYILSKNLLVKATEPDGHWQQRHSGAEDVLTGQAVSSTARKYNLCVHTWPQELAQVGAGYYHFRLPETVCGTDAWARYYHCREPELNAW